MTRIPWRGKGRSDSDASPASPVSRLREDMEDLFERFLHEPFTALTAGCSFFERALRLEMIESDNDVTIRAEVPGVDAKDIQLEVTGDVLTIRGERKREEQCEEADCHYSERQYGSFRRSVRLPVPVDSDKVEAVCKDGVLTITLLKDPESRPKRIAIRDA